MTKTQPTTGTQPPSTVAPPRRGAGTVPPASLPEPPGGPTPIDTGAGASEAVGSQARGQDEHCRWSPTGRHDRVPFGIMVHANDTATRHEKCTHCNKYWRILFPDVPAEIWLLANHDLEWVRLRPPGAAPRPRVLVSF